MKKNVKEKITLKDLEKDPMAKVGFIIHNRKCICTIIRREIENRVHAKIHHDIASEEYDNLIHGYMTKEKIVLYQPTFEILEKGKLLSNDYDGDPGNFIFPGEWCNDDKHKVMLVINEYRKIFNNDNWTLYVSDKGELKALHTSVEYHANNSYRNFS